MYKYIRERLWSIYNGFISFLGKRIAKQIGLEDSPNPDTTTHIEKKIKEVLTNKL